MVARSPKGRAYELAYLSDEFYLAYPKPPYDEILTKGTRPYAVLLTEVNGHQFALPFRSNINHKYCFRTSSTRKCGIDYSKAVAILRHSYIDWGKQAWINDDEHNALKGKDWAVKKGFLEYLEIYKKAKMNMHVPRNASLVGKSSLQYFEDCFIDS